MLGFQFTKVEMEVGLIPHSISVLLEERMEARCNREWNVADSLRDSIEKDGYRLIDVDSKTIIKKKI